MAGMAYRPQLVSMAPLMLGPSTSTMKERGMPELFFILTGASEFLSCHCPRHKVAQDQSNRLALTHKLTCKLPRLRDTFPGYVLTPVWGQFLM